MLLLGKQLVGERALPTINSCDICLLVPPKSYLESSSQTEDTVVGLLGGKTLEGKENSLGLFRDQIIGSAHSDVLAKALLGTLHTSQIQLT